MFSDTYHIQRVFPYAECPETKNESVSRNSSGSCGFSLRKLPEIYIRLNTDLDLWYCLGRLSHICLLNEYRSYSHIELMASGIKLQALHFIIIQYKLRRSQRFFLRPSLMILEISYLRCLGLMHIILIQVLRRSFKLRRHHLKKKKNFQTLLFWIPRFLICILKKRKVV